MRPGLSKVSLFALGLCLSAQTPDTATIRGHVVDQTRAGIPGVQVTAKNTQSGLERATQTDDTGRFSLAGLPISGKYEVTAKKSNFSEASLNDVTLAGGTTADVNLQLSVAGGETQVTVTGVAGEVRADQPQLGDR